MGVCTSVSTAIAFFPFENMAQGNGTADLVKYSLFSSSGSAVSAVSTRNPVQLYHQVQATLQCTFYRQPSRTDLQRFNYSLRPLRPIHGVQPNSEIQDRGTVGWLTCSCRTSCVRCTVQRPECREGANGIEDAAAPAGYCRR